MSNQIKVVIPDLGGAQDVEVIEVLVKIGDTVTVDQPLLSLESDKASMEVPSSHAGVVEQVLVSLGDTVNQGDAIIELSADQAASSANETDTNETDTSAEVKEPSTPTENNNNQSNDYQTEVVVIGSGPGGYTAAFRAADLGLKVTLIERYSSLGGVCLNVGCIPSKALLHTAAVINEAQAMQHHGVSFGEPSIEVDKLRGFKESVINQLTSGLAKMAKARKVEVIEGYAKFIDDHTLSIENEGKSSKLTFGKAIIAAGSHVTVLPTFDIDDPRIIDSTGALALTEIPESMLIVGGGIIGLEMATVYSALGTEVSIVEFMPQIMPGADKDLIAPLQKRLKGKVKQILTSTKVEKLTPTEAGIIADFATVKGEALEPQTFDKVLVATGRTPNGKRIDAEKAGVNVDDRGFIAVNQQMQTNVPHIFAIGDIVGQPMLAHKATHEAKVAAEVCAGEKSGFEANVIPSVAYTDPEIAWVGLTETQAKEQGIDYQTGVFPWAASGRAIGNDRTEGKTKLLFDPKNNRVLGGGIVGTNAGDLIAEVALAIEMGADAEDIGLTIHPHPTLSETVAMAAEAYEGTITDLYIPKRK